MDKIARIVAELQPHQLAAVNRALKHNLILAHSTGSGKTLTSIAIADALNKPTTVLTPASLVENYKKEVAKYKVGGPPIKVLSLPTAVSRNYKVPKGNTLIVDEAHSLRNSNTNRYDYVSRQALNADRVFGLTGTPAYNAIDNWAPLVNIVAKQPVFPKFPALFKSNYIDRRKVYPGLVGSLLGAKPGTVEELKNAENLRRRLHPYVDVFDVDVEKPERIDEHIKVPVEGQQLETYNKVESDIPINLRYSLMNNLPVNKQDSKSLNAFLSGVRQVSNTARPFNVAAPEAGSKLQAAADNLIKDYNKNKKLRAFVYSNYLDAGVIPYSHILDKAKVPYKLFHGGLSQAQKKQIVDEYNTGRINAILGTGSASEGLDLKKTNLIQILEPHFNNAKIEQVIGRGIRYKSHDELPKEERKVRVQQYESVRPETTLQWLFGTKPSTLVDGYLMSRAAEKQRIVDQVKEILKNDRN